MKKPREFYVSIIAGSVIGVADTLKNIKARMAIFDMPNEFEYIKVKEITNEPRTTKAKASRAKDKTSRPERARITK